MGHSYTSTLSTRPHRSHLMTRSPKPRRLAIGAMTPIPHVGHDAHSSRLGRRVNSHTSAVPPRSAFTPVPIIQTPFVEAVAMRVADLVKHHSGGIVVLVVLLIVLAPPALSLAGWAIGALIR